MVESKTLYSYIGIRAYTAETVISLLWSTELMPSEPINFTIAYLNPKYLSTVARKMPTEAFFHTTEGVTIFQHYWTCKTRRYFLVLVSNT